MKNSLVATNKSPTRLPGTPTTTVAPLVCHGHRARSAALEAGQRLGPLRLAIDDRLGVTRGRSGLQSPRLMDARGLQLSKLGNVAADVVPVGVEAFRLGYRIEHPCIGRRIRAGAGHPLPAVTVRGQVAVDEVSHDRWADRCPKSV